MDPAGAGALTAAQVISLARSRPWAGTLWAVELLDALPARLDRAITRWRLTLERAHLEGAGLPVLEVGARLGGREVPAVVKFGGVGSELAQQLRVLTAADGRGYVRVLDHDEEAGAVLLERLGPTLGRAEADPSAQTDVLADLLEQAWQLPLEVGLPYAPEEKARGLLSGIEEAPAAVGPAAADAPSAGGLRPRGPDGEVGRHRTLERARELARSLAASPSRTQVVVHGDPHSSNVLRRGRGFALIDPDGFRCEPDYDAGVALRDHLRHLDRLDRAQGTGSGRRWHEGLTRSLASRLGLDADRVAAWAFVERVTTGLHLGMLGYDDEGESWLRTADRMMR